MVLHQQKYCAVLNVLWLQIWKHTELDPFLLRYYKIEILTLEFLIFRENMLTYTYNILLIFPPIASEPKNVFVKTCLEK